MINLFLILFLITAVATVVFLFKPTFTQFNNRPAMSRKSIGIGGTVLSLIFLFIVGTLAPPVPKQAVDDEIPKNTVPAIEPKAEKVAKTQSEVDKEDNKPPFELTDDPKQNVANAQAHYEKLAEEDKPHFDWPRVDYTKTVAKVDLNNDKAILKAVGKPVIEKEDSGNQNGEPATIYYFSKDLVNGLDITLSREFIHVNWQFDPKNPDKATASFEDGQRITRALLGGKVGSELYENIAKGLKYDEITTDDGVVIKNARCGATICRYEVLR